MTGVRQSFARRHIGKKFLKTRCLNVKSNLTWLKTRSCNAQKKGTLGAKALDELSMFADFKRDCRGKVVIIFALILIPLLAVVWFVGDFQ